MRQSLSSNSLPVTQKILSRPAKKATIRFGLLTWLFLIFSIYLVLPIWDVPLLGLSLSAPIFFVIAINSVARPPKPWSTKYRRWIWLAVGIWFGIAISSLINGILATGNYSSSDFLSLVRFAYWLLVFVITTYFVSSFGLGSRLSRWLLVGIIILALLRWGEALLLGRMGAGASRIMTQNGYGFLFSCFASFVLPPLFSTQGRKRFLAWLAALLVWGAVLINGSRSSWIGLTVGALIYVLLHLWSTPRRTAALLISFSVVIGSAMVLMLVPDEIFAVVNDRFSTFDQLDREKSYGIRLYMNQKAWLLFEDSPLIGVGIGNFRESQIDIINLPRSVSGMDYQRLESLSAHNSYAAFIAETGLAGVIPFGSMILSLLLLGSKAALGLNRRGAGWALAYLAGFISMSIHMWAITGLATTVTWYVYGLVSAMIVAERNQPWSEKLERKTFI